MAPSPLPPTGRAKAAIFDMDGLLVDTEPIWRDVTVAVLDALGSDVRPVVDRGLTKGMRVDESLAVLRAVAPWSGPGDAEVEAKIVDGVVAAVAWGAELMPGALQALDYLAAEGMVLALASGSVPRVVEAILGHFGLVERFAVIRSASEVPLGKPHPALFLETARSLGVEPSDCVVLEDSLNGCIAAKSAQMRVVVVPAACERDDPRFVLADLVLSSLEAITGPEVAALLGLSAPRASGDDWA